MAHLLSGSKPAALRRGFSASLVVEFVYKLFNLFVVGDYENLLFRFCSIDCSPCPMDRPGLLLGYPIVNHLDNPVRYHLGNAAYCLFKEQFFPPKRMLETNQVIMFIGITSQNQVAGRIMTLCL